MYRLPSLSRLLDSERSEDTVVDRVVQEQYLRRLDEDTHERQETVGYDEVYAAPEGVAQSGYDRTGAKQTDDGEQATQDTGREVVYQHLEALADFAFDEAVEPLDHDPAEWSHNERAEEHRYVGPDYHAHGGYRPDDSPTHVVD